MTNSSDSYPATRPQRAVSAGVVGRRNDHDGDRRACRNTKHVHESSNLHLNLETLVGCLDRIHQDVPKCGIPGISSSGCRGLPSPCHNFVLDGRGQAIGSAFVVPKTAPRPLNRLARCRRRFPGRLPRFSANKALPCSQVDDAVSPASSTRGM